MSSPIEHFMPVPELGEYYIPRDWADLLNEIRAEMLDERWFGHPHGLQKVYVRGCRGPLCKWANRTYYRRWTHSKVQSNNGKINPYVSPLDKYHGFLEVYAARAIEASGDTWTERATPKPRIVRTPHLVPASTVQHLHKGRASLAS